MSRSTTYHQEQISFEAALFSAPEKTQTAATAPTADPKDLNNQNFPPATEAAAKKDPAERSTTGRLTKKDLALEKLKSKDPLFLQPENFPGSRPDTYLKGLPRVAMDRQHAELEKIMKDTKLILNDKGGVRNLRKSREIESELKRPELEQSFNHFPRAFLGKMAGICKGYHKTTIPSSMLAGKISEWLTKAPQSVKDEASRWANGTAKNLADPSFRVHPNKAHVLSIFTKAVRKGIEKSQGSRLL